MGSQTKHIDVLYHYICEIRELGEQVVVLFVHSENNSSDIFTKNGPERIITEHGSRIREGTLQCREDWFKLVESIKHPEKTIHHVQWEDAKLWIEQRQLEDDIWSELACTFREDYCSLFGISR
jgi:hypothetical protein